MIATRGLGRDDTRSTNIVSMGLGQYVIVIDDLGRIRIVRVETSVDKVDVRLDVKEAI